ncbi:TPA: hypothetical protein PXJ53_003323 [Yersinia enterocolitica]|uniref:hypothetical protein n=1 Tax=Yersinia enterocolitica TaxID=630 RepID=UPI0028B87079|nr:hypothetical protein [Yersinia enterocolitica]EKN4808188.1 hypothetical protein [Yersinia enterocolitica]EKN5159035.1 hypothetical protein [Yersinia enterocolitica]EKN6235793.1 hypothetical protein [Yersinia enterocolitica]EKN6261759.1 hypothetical protein [Yersinia enterocolitica]
MKFRTISLGLALAVMSSSVLAVDGYKGVKFGSNVDTLLKSNICSFEKYNSDTPGLISYACRDFKFSGAKTIAMAFFLDGKFQRLAISLNRNSESVLDGLIKKYGAPSSASTAEEMERASTSGEAIYVRFDHDTVYMRGQKNRSTGKEDGFLIYTSPEYEKELLKIQSKAVQDDL